MDKVIKILNKIGYSVISKKIDDIEYNYCFIGGRIFFLKNLSGEKSLECMIDLAIHVSETIDKHTYRVFLSDSIISYRDIEVRFLDLRAFLWDIYIIGYAKYQNESVFSDEEKSKIGRNKFIARKIVIEEANTKAIINRLVSIFKPEREFDLIVDKYSNTICEDSIIKSLLDKHLTDENSAEENIELKSRILKQSKKENEAIKIDDIIVYLQAKKTELSNYKSPV